MLEPRDFYKKVYDKMNAKAGQLRSMESELQRLESQKKDQAFSMEYKRNTLSPEINRLRFRIRDELEAWSLEINKLCDGYLKELEAADALKPEELTPDVQLLSMGLLNKKDVLAMLDRNKTNPSMVQVILRYCEREGIETGVSYNGKYNVAKALVKSMPYVSTTAMKYYGDSPTFDKLIGEGSDIQRGLCEE